MSYHQDFIDSLPEECLKVPSEFLDPDWIDDPKNLPFTAAFENRYVFMIEDDFRFADTKQRGVMYDLWKQLYGCAFLETPDLYDEEGNNLEEMSYEDIQGIDSVTSTRTFLPNPAQYQWWAWTAHVLMKADNLDILGVRPTYNRNLDGGDIARFINKLGFFGLNEEMERKKRLTLARFAPLYARMYNNDPRYTSEFSCIKKLEALKVETTGLEEALRIASRSNYRTGELHVKHRESPLKYCSVCGAITDVWKLDEEGNSTVVKPGDPSYEKYSKKVGKQMENNKREKDAKPDQDRFEKHRFTTLNVPQKPKS